MDNNPVSRSELLEIEKRLDAENERQNHRLESAENDIKGLRELHVAVEKLATNMERMFEEQRRQGARLETLESRDGELWRKVAGYALTAGAGFLLAALMRQAGIF